MLGKRRLGWVLRLLVTDALALVASFGVAYVLRFLLNQPLGRQAGPLGYYAWLLVLILPVWMGLLAVLGAYGVRWTVRSRAWLVLRVCTVGLVCSRRACSWSRRARSTAACSRSSPPSARSASGSSGGWSPRGFGARDRIGAGLASRWSWAPTSGPSGSSPPFASIPRPPGSFGDASA